MSENRLRYSLRWLYRLLREFLRLLGIGKASIKNAVKILGVVLVALGFFFGIRYKIGTQTSIQIGEAPDPVTELISLPLGALVFGCLLGGYMLVILGKALVLASGPILALSDDLEYKPNHGFLKTRISRKGFKSVEVKLRLVAIKTASNDEWQFQKNLPLDLEVLRDSGDPLIVLGDEAEPVSLLQYHYQQQGRESVTVRGAREKKYQLPMGETVYLQVAVAAKDNKEYLRRWYRVETASRLLKGCAEEPEQVAS